MTRYVKGHTGPMLPAAGPRGSAGAVLPTNPRPAAGKPTVSGIPKPAPTGPMTPVRGGGMAPASAATTMKKAPMMKKGGSVSSASKRADGIAKQGKTKGKIC